MSNFLCVDFVTESFAEELFFVSQTDTPDGPLHQREAHPGGKARIFQHFPLHQSESGTESAARSVLHLEMSVA